MGHGIVDLVLMCPRLLSEAENYQIKCDNQGKTSENVGPRLTEPTLPDKHD